MNLQQINYLDVKLGGKYVLWGYKIIFYFYNVTTILVLTKTFGFRRLKKVVKFDVD